MGYFDYLNDGDGGGSPRRFFSYLDEEEAARNKPPVDDRTLAAYANDTVIDTVNTGVGALKTIPDLLSPGNAVSAGAERFIASGQEKQSDYRQAARAFEAKSMADAKARGEYGIGQMLSNYADRPTGLLTDAVGNIAPTVLTGGVASAVGRAGALAQGATLAQAGATGATTGRVAAGVLGAGMGAGGTRGGYYDAIQGSPDEKLLEGSPEYRKMRETLSERDAKDALGKTITPELAAAIGISGLAEGISRATGLEALAAGRAATGGLGAALRTGAVEVGSEAATGGIQQLGQNVGVQQRLPETGLLDDVALSSVQEALIAGPGAVAAGAVEFSRPPSTMGDALLGTPDPAADANPMAVFQGATVEESIRLAADELGKATRMSDDVLMRTRDYIAQEMSTALGGIHEQALSILGAPTAPPPGFDPFAERAAQVAGQEQAERDLGAEAMAGTLKTQREAMASALKTQREAQAEEQVAQAEAVTRAQGFDAAEPTAMGLAMQRALSQTATQTEARAKAQAQVQGLGVAEPALTEPALAEPTTQTAAGQTAAGQTAGQTAAAAEPPAADPPVRASDERLAQQNRPEDIGASSAPAAISTSSTAQEAVLGRQPAGATNSAQDPAATATTVGLTETPQAPRPAGRAQALNDALNISRKGSAVKANTYEVNIKDLPEKRTAVETGVKGATTLSRSEAETVVNFAKVFNKKVVFFRSENGVDTLDGAVVGGDNTSIYLNADASAAHHLVVAGHEIGHLMRTDAPKLYEQLTKRLSSELTGGKLANFSRYYGTDPKEVYAKLRDAEQRDALVEEYISDLIGNRVGEYRTALDLFGAAKGSKDPGLIYKVGQFVINFIDQLLAKTGFKKFTTDAMVRDLVKVRREVRTALKEYAKERQAAVATTVDEKANVAATSPLNPVPDPTPAQKEAGNYRKGRVSISGLDVSIENPAGSSRRPEWPALKDHYGYLVGTKGMDGDHIDVFVRPGMSEDYDGPVFVVDQVHPKTRKPDEHKVMLGYATKLGAVKAYMSNYEKGWGGFGSIAEMSQEEFRQWAYSGNVPALAADAKLSTARVSDVGHRREMSSGRYVGAPEWVGSSPSKLAYLRKKIRQLAVEGERGRYWYERSSKAILDLAGGDKAEAERIVSLIALYSPNATVPANTTMALTAYYQHKAGVPIKAGFGDANRKAEELLGEGKVWSGIKTNSFYQNLMVEIDPSKLDPGVATMDMWMALAFDYGMKTLDQGPKYRFAERETQRLADELGWKAHQVQAAIWVATKGRIDQIRPLLKQQELKTGIGRLVEKDGKEIYEVLPAKRKEHFRLAHKLGMAYKLSDADITASSYDFSNAIKSAQVQMSWEATPSKSKGDIPGIHSASYEQKAEYLQAVMKALTQDGRNLIADMSGLPEGSTLAGFSAWEGDVGAGAQTFLAAPAEGASTRRAVKGPARDVLNLHAALTGYVLGQDAVVWHQPVYDAAKKNHNGVDIAFARPLNEGEFQLIYRALHDQFGTWELAPAYTPRGVRVLNFVEGLDNKAFQDGVAAVVESLPADFGDSATADVTSYKSDGEYIFNDWQENPNGEGYLERIRAGRPDLQQRAADVRARVEALNRDFEKKYRWGRPDAGSRGRNRGVREGVRESAQRQDERVSYGTARDGATSVTGYHFSTESRRSLNSSAYGRGLAGEEAKRLQGADPRLSKRIYFYIDRGEGIAPEAGVGAHAHRVTLENLYDVDADALRIVRDTEGSFNNVESAIIDAGFDGYFTRQFNKSGAAVLLGSHSVTVERLGTSRGFTNTETPVAPAPQRDLNAAERIASNKALPMGQLTGLRWAEILKRSMPDTFEQFADSPVWQSSYPMYKDVLARTLARPAQVRASPQRKFYDEDYPDSKSLIDGVKNGDLLVHVRVADGTDFEYGIDPSAGDFLTSTEAYQAAVEEYGEGPELTFFSDGFSWANGFIAKRQGVDESRLEMVFVRKDETIQKSLGDGRVQDSSGKEMSYEMSPMAVYESDLYRDEPAGVETGDWYTNKAQDVVGVLPASDAPVSGQNGEGDATGGAKRFGATRFSRAPAVDTPEFKAWFGDSRVVDELTTRAGLVSARQTAMLERGPDSYPSDSEAISDLLVSPTFSLQGLSGLDAPSQRKVLDGVLTLGENDDVLRAVIELIPVDVVNDLARKKTSAEQLFRNESVLSDLLSFDGKGSVSVAVDVADSLVVAVANVAAKLSGTDARMSARNGESSAATRTDVGERFHPDSLGEIKTVGNNGQFDPANPDIRASEQRSEYLGDLDARQEAALRNVGGITPKQTLRQRMDAFGKDLGLRIRQGMVDEYASIRTVDEDAYRAARLSGATDGALEASMLYGKPFLNGNAYDVNVNDEGFAKILADLGGEHDRFLWWVAATRAKRLKLEGRENLFTDADISALESLNVGREAKFDTALRKLNEFNDAMLQIAVDSGIMDDAARQLFKNQPYVPFYRVLEDEGAVRGPTMSSGLVNQYATKKLKGGTDKLNNDLMSNLLRNWSHLLSASAKNRAATLAMDAAVPLGVVTKVPSGTKKSVRIMRLGKEEHYLIDDPHMYAAVSAIARTNPAWMKPFSSFKRWLTIGVTANPSFKIRNLIRDSLSAISQNELSYNALQNVRQGWAASAKDSQTRASMLASGGVLRFGTMIEGDRGSAVDRIVKKAAGHTILNAKGFDKLAEMMRVTWETYNDLGDKSENANRAALYEQLMARGYSHADASFMARDLMDFSMSGRWEVVKFLTQSVPFLNARMQGLYKLGRASAQNPRRMGTMIAAVSLASVALMLAGLGDEDWDKREEWDRDANWWFKIGDKAFRIPKPFELGAVGTIAERTAQMFFDPKMTGKRYTDSLSHMFSQTFSLSPVPQIVKPFVDIYSNVDSFTGRPIETLGMERLRPEDRVSERTSSTARLLGQLGLPDPLKIAMGRYQPLSPVQIDSAVRGYFGWLGTTTTALLDFGMRPALGLPPRAAMQLRDAFIAGNFTESLPSGSSRYVTAMYEQARDVTQAYASLRDAQKSGDNERVREIVETERDKLSRYRAMNAATSRLSDINRNAKIIQASRTMSPQEKRRALDALAQTRDRIAQQVIQ